MAALIFYLGDSCQQSAVSVQKNIFVFLCVFARKNKSLQSTHYLYAQSSRLDAHRQCVRDWSGILLERSGKRYSGKPDGDSRNAQRNYKFIRRFNHWNLIKQDIPIQGPYVPRYRDAHLQIYNYLNIKLILVLLFYAVMFCWRKECIAV